jgi:hypothetical protein
MADGKDIAAIVNQGGVFMPAVNTATNVREFPKPENPNFDPFLLKIGAKEMVTTPKKETEATTAIRWNQSVIGLLTAILVLVSALVTIVWGYATLSATVSYDQKEREKLELRVKALEDVDRKRQSDADTLKGYKYGKLENEGKEDK